MSIAARGVCKASLFRKAHAGARRRTPSAPYTQRFSLALRRAWEEAQLEAWEIEKGFSKPAPVADSAVTAWLAKWSAKLEAKIAAEEGMTIEEVRSWVASGPKLPIAPPLSAKLRSAAEAPLRPG